MSDMEFPEPFDPESEQGNTWEPLPVGEYVAQVIEAGIAPPKTGNGYALTLVWKVMEGDFEGRQVWQQICYLHPKEQTQSIARKALKDICVALDIHEAVQNADIFLFRPVLINVGIRKDKDGIYADQNKVGRVRPLTGPSSTAVPAGQPSPPKSDNGGVAAAPETPKPAAAPRTQGPARPGPAGSAPWHKSK